MNLTRAIAIGLNKTRLLKFGKEARLVFAFHAQSRGYSKGIEIVTNWCPKDLKAGPGESVGQIQFKVCEILPVTFEMLSTCAGFAFMRKHEDADQVIIHKVVERFPPLDELNQTWIFFTTPSRKERMAI